MSHFDLKMTDAGWEMLRYADDIIIFAETEERAKSAYTLARDLLISMGLNMHELSSDPKAKTKIRRTNSDGVEFVGFRAQTNQIFPGSKTLAKFRADIQEMTNVENMNRKTKKIPFDRRDSLISRATSISNKTEGKAASLACCSECQEISQLSKFVEDRFIGMFERLGLRFPDRNPERLKMVGVPNLFEIWRDRRDGYKRKAVVPTAQKSDAITWADQNRSSLTSAFKQIQTA
ncbi:MAG: hypothetical protein IPJ35_05620 [Elusimicrobia bacterium]|nr:hypothetical protein [Elusimicrobiota bacterium]